MNCKLFLYNQQTITQRENDFVNLNEMCKANQKQVEEYLSLQSTQDYIALYNAFFNNKVVEQDLETQEFWGHPIVALALARWISDDFSVWCLHHLLTELHDLAKQIEIDYHELYNIIKKNLHQIQSECGRLEWRVTKTNGKMTAHHYVTNTQKQYLQQFINNDYEV